MTSMFPRLGSLADPARSPSCQEGYDELAGGMASLVTALFFFAWSGFDLALLLVSVATMLFGKRFFR